MSTEIPIALKAYRKWIAEILYYYDLCPEDKIFLIKFALQRKGFKFNYLNRQKFRCIVYPKRVDHLTLEMRQEAHRELLPLLNRRTNHE